MKPKYKRLLLKLSGEALLPEGQSYGVRIESGKSIVDEVAPVLKSGVQVAIVIGGGNIFRGAAAPVKEGGIGRAQAESHFISDVLCHIWIKVEFSYFPAVLVDLILLPIPPLLCSVLKLRRTPS